MGSDSFCTCYRKEREIVNQLIFTAIYFCIFVIIDIFAAIYFCKLLFLANMDHWQKYIGLQSKSTSL